MKAKQCFIDPAFGRNAAPHCVLAADLSHAHVTFAVYDRHRSLWVALEEWPGDQSSLSGSLLEHLAAIRERSALLGFSYEQTIILWNSRQYTMIPKALFQPGAEAEYLRFAHNLSAGDCVLCDEMTSLDSVMVYSMPLVLHEGLHQLFPGARFQHAVANLAGSQFIRFRNSLPATKVLLHADQRIFDMLVFRDRGLLFCNSFEYSNADDLAYYTLFVMDQLKLDPREQPVLLAGYMNRPSPLDDLLNRYIAGVSYITANPQWKYSYVFDEMAPHIHYNLLNLLVCES